MHSEHEPGRPLRQCAATGREFAPGEARYSALVAIGERVERRDVADEAWNGPPEGAIAWWRWRTPGAGAPKPKAPTDALLALVDQWDGREEFAAARYVVALLLVRRRVLRLEPASLDEGLASAGPRLANSQQWLALRSQRSGELRRVAVTPPTPDEAARVQRLLESLLDEDAAPAEAAPPETPKAA